MSDPDELAARLAALAQAGVASWDEPATRVVERLLERAADCEPALAEHLHARAAAHLGQLEAAFGAAKTRAELAFEHLTRAGKEPLLPQSALREKLESGAFESLQRLVRHATRARDESTTERLEQRRARLTEVAQRRGIGAGAGLEGDPRALAAALYRDSAAGANARRTVSRATASVPADAGHYNAHRVAARMLEALSAHPAYLKAQLARLETLALLQPPPEPKPKPRGRRKTRGSSE